MKKVVCLDTGYVKLSMFWRFLSHKEMMPAYNANLSKHYAKNITIEESVKMAIN